MVKLLSWILRKLGLTPPTLIVCRRCGYEIPVEDIGTKIPISGYDSEHSFTHIHCPRCGKMIGYHVRE